MVSNKVPRNGNLKMCIRKRVRYGYMYACKLFLVQKKRNNIQLSNIDILVCRYKDG